LNKDALTSLPPSTTRSRRSGEGGSTFPCSASDLRYEKLLEDLDDLAVVAERRDEPTIPHEQFVSELKRDGLL